MARALASKNGKVLAISVDAAADSARMVDELALDFPILCDSAREVTQLYGLVHDGGGPGGKSIAIPAQFLIDADGRIAWRHVARRINDRVDPAQTLAQVERL